MHEYSIVQALIDRVQKEVDAHGAAAVHGIRVRIGEFSGVEIELLRSAYELFSEKSVCEGAKLEIVQVPARWTCRGCGAPIGTGEILCCPVCGQPARLTEGDEILLERIEMEVA
jgi:hydrogenase nickel incorporation protein HypA/HybF